MPMWRCLQPASVPALAPGPTAFLMPPVSMRCHSAGMVLVVNTVLAWLMFSIDVRNAMLR